jgi:hypothetical protein
MSASQLTTEVLVHYRPVRFRGKTFTLSDLAMEEFKLLAWEEIDPRKVPAIAEFIIAESEMLVVIQRIKELIWQIDFRHLEMYKHSLMMTGSVSRKLLPPPK